MHVALAAAGRTAAAAATRDKQAQTVQASRFISVSLRECFKPPPAGQQAPNGRSYTTLKLLTPPGSGGGHSPAGIIDG